jgi:hypothetical protein
LKFWFSDKVLHPPEPPKPAAEVAEVDKKPDAAAKPAETTTAKADKPKKKKKPHILTLADLPPACKDVLQAPARQVLESKAH